MLKSVFESKKTSMAAAFVVVLTAVGLQNEEAKAIADIVVVALIALGLFLSKDGDK